MLWVRIKGVRHTGLEYTGNVVSLLIFSGGPYLDTKERDFLVSRPDEGGGPTIITIIRKSRDFWRLRMGM